MLVIRKISESRLLNQMQTKLKMKSWKMKFSSDWLKKPFRFFESHHVFKARHGNIRWNWSEI